MATRKRRGASVYTAEAVVMTLLVGLVFLGVLVGWVVGHYATPGHTKTVTVAAGQTAVEETTAISPAPAFSMNDLASLPTENWPTNGGSLANERYSPLDQIDTGKMRQVKAGWGPHLEKSPITPKYS